MNGAGRLVLTLPAVIESDGTERRKPMADDVRSDPYRTIEQWIRAMRLSGGVHGDEEEFSSLQSARDLSRRLAFPQEQNAGPFLDIASRFLWAYMIAMANRPDEAVEMPLKFQRDDLQGAFRELAQFQPPGPVRLELERVAALEPRIFASAMSVIGLY